MKFAEIVLYWERLYILFVLLNQRMSRKEGTGTDVGKEMRDELGTHCHYQLLVLDLK